MSRFYVYPWDQLSKSAGEIAEALGTKKLLRKGSSYKPRKGDVIVNWGGGDFQDWAHKYDPYHVAKYLNTDNHAVLDKRQFFERAKRNPYVPRCAFQLKDAKQLKFPVVCRTKIKGHDGAGIVIAETPDELVEAKLYVELEEKTAEYRVHVGRNKETSIIGVQRKFLPNGANKEQKRVRTTANGCYFVWNVDGKPVEVPHAVRLAALSVFAEFPELDFGGLDVIYDEEIDTAAVLEINTAPEMTPKSCQLYADFFRTFEKQEPIVVEPEKEKPAVKRPDVDDAGAAFRELGEHIADMSMKEMFYEGWAAYQRYLERQ